MVHAVALGAVASTSLLAAAGQASAVQTPQKGGILKAGLQGGSATDSLDPATFASQVDNFFGRQWGEQLVQLTGSGELQPALAEEWGSSKDAKAWTFKIRKGVEFHNGKTLTAADVVATYERHSDKNSKSGALGLLKGLESVKQDGDTVVLTMTEPNADLPFLLDDFHLMIQPNGGKDRPTEGIGTGPYRVTTNEPGIRHGGERFPNYWRNDRGFADQIEIIVINDASARTAALQSGQVDMINRVEPKIVELLKKVPGVTVQNAPGKGHYVFTMQCITSPFDSKDLRLALKYAIDREEMVKKILAGYGSVGNDTPINSVYANFTDSPQRAYDPDKAAFHYKKSGHSGPIMLRTSDVAFPGAVDAAQLYQQSAANAGISLDVKREPGDGYWSSVWNVAPFFAGYWNGRATQDQMFSTAYYSKADWNDSRFFDERFDQLLLQARGETDPTKRKNLYADMNAILREEGGMIVPMFNDFIDAHSAKVLGWAKNGNQELMGGYALSKCWFQA
ncbi:ABC transporter substrate-binding protein [Mesorhizobium sp. M0700]|uniref:ABC transporter substrate-binding protein n=1 Tax=Mesorhizobium sp. M0700 TaxID=2956988 RepID=UPI003336BC58